MMNSMAQYIAQGKAFLGMEFGSTRIKAVLIDQEHQVIASGSHTWENRLENGIWTYHFDEVWAGMQACYLSLTNHVREQYQTELTTLAGIGISGMMHGYIALDSENEPLAPFRTWRNTMTGEAAAALTKCFNFNVPQRWNVAHLYQSILNNEEHVSRIVTLTTLAGYVHLCLTGRKILGAGEASGVFPLDELSNYDSRMLEAFDKLIEDKMMPWKLRELLPDVLTAGEQAGVLTAQGANLLDPTGRLQAGISVCPPEGDAGTGMVATNSVAERTGNISAGTSIFAMLVLEKQLSAIYPEIDIVATPSGRPVAMVHCNNGLSELDAWVKTFGEAAELMGAHVDRSVLYDKLYQKALEGESDGGDLLACNYLSGEHITGFDKGCPLFLRMPESRFNLANFMRVQLFSILATVAIGIRLLVEKEQVGFDVLNGHGGLFKTKNVGQRMLAAAVNTPVAVLRTAGEGGAWGIALLAAYMINRRENETLEVYLASRVFSDNSAEIIMSNAIDVEGFDAYLKKYRNLLEVEKTATRALE